MNFGLDYSWPSQFHMQGAHHLIIITQVWTFCIKITEYSACTWHYPPAHVLVWRNWFQVPQRCHPQTLHFLAFLYSWPISFCIEKKKKCHLSSVFAPYTFYMPSPLHWFISDYFIAKFYLVQGALFPYSFPNFNSIKLIVSYVINLPTFPVYMVKTFLG